jgi:hypothetical protein
MINRGIIGCGNVTEVKRQKAKGKRQKAESSRRNEEKP